MAWNFLFIFRDMSRMRSKRYWFIFITVFILTIAIISQLIGWTLRDNSQLAIMIIAGLGFSFLLSPLLMKW